MSRALFTTIVAGAGDGEVDHAGWPDLDPGQGETSAGGVAGGLDIDAAVGQRVHHHGGPAGSGGQDADFPSPHPASSSGYAEQERQAADQALEGVHPCDAAFGQKHVGDIVLARQRPGVRDRELARRGRASELVGEHRLAALACRERKTLQGTRVPHGLEKQHVAVDAGVIERELADLSEREVDLVADRNEPGEAHAACLAAGEQCSDHASGVGGDEGAPDRQLLLVKGRVRGQHRLAAQVDHAEARWSHEAQPAARAYRAQPLLARDSGGAGLRKAVGEHGCDLHAELPAILDRGDGRLGRRHHVDVVGRLRQRRERGPRALAQHRRAP